MWILIKLCVAGCAFVYRFFSNRYVPTYDSQKKINDFTISIKKSTNKHNHVTETQFAIPFPSRALFKLTPEGPIDAFFKKLRLTNEFQTGDRSFDDVVYIASDSEAFHKELTSDATARTTIKRLFASDCRSIHANGQRILFKFLGDESHNTALITLCTEVFASLQDVDKNWKAFLHDPYNLRIILVEAVIWSIAGYAAANFSEWYFDKQDTHLDIYPLISQGLILGLCFALCLFALVVAFLRKSSRGHRILVEGFVLLSFAIPIGSVSAIGDINDQWDPYEPTAFTATVTDLYRRTHRGRKGRTWYSYHLHIEPQLTDISPQLLPEAIPRHIQIDGGLFATLRQGGHVAITLGRGRLHHWWYRDIRPTP